jgi:hypothetical protein
VGCIDIHRESVRGHTLPIVTLLFFLLILINALVISFPVFYNSTTDKGLNFCVKINYMKDSLRTGVTFGLTSAVITTLGLMVGLHAGTHSKMVVLGGVLTIAIADAFSDALGIHISEESENVHTTKQIWAATIATFLSKFLFAMTFVVPVLLFSLSTAIGVNLIWGLSVLTVLSYIIAKSQSEPPWKIVGEHLIIAFVVIAITYCVGLWIETMIV